MIVTTYFKKVPYIPLSKVKFKDIIGILSLMYYFYVPLPYITYRFMSNFLVSRIFGVSGV
jgi:hypothetical protein